MGCTRHIEALDLAVLKFVSYEGYMKYNNMVFKYFELDFPEDMFTNLSGNRAFQADTIILHWCNILQVNIHDFLMLLYTENRDLHEVCLNVKLSDFLGARECVWFVKLRDHVHDEDEMGCTELLNCLFPDQMLEIVNARNARLLAETE